MKTVSNSEQNFRACLPAIAGREAFAVLEKAGGLPSRRVGVDGPDAWLPAGPQSSNPRGGWVGSQSETFSSVKLLIFFAGQPWPALPCSLSGLQPASQTQARWVSRLCVDRLLAVD